MTAERIEAGVVSGPDRLGRWHWRPTKGGESQPLDPDWVDPDWRNGQKVEMRVRRTFKGVEVIGPAIDPAEESAAPDDPVLLNGQPLKLPPSRDLEPGVVVIAPIPYSARDPGDPEREEKRRPAVVVRAEDEVVVVRAVYSRNTEGRGRRLQDPVPAGLAPGSALSHDDTLVSRTEISVPQPQRSLSPVDMHLLR